MHDADLLKSSGGAGTRRGSGGGLFGADDVSALMDADSEAYLFFLRSGLPSALLKDIVEVCSPVREAGPPLTNHVRATPAAAPRWPSL